MAKRMKTTIEVLMYEGVTQSNDPTDLDKVKLILEESSITELFRRREAIVTGTSDYAITMPDSQTDYVVIFTDQQISIKISGAATALPLKPKTAGTKAFAFYMRGTISSLSITNASGSTANVDIIAVNI